MKLEYQVCSLELAKKLKELYVKQESYFRWVRLGEKREDWVITQSQSFQEGYSAFTVAELGEMLPKSCPEHKNKDLLICKGFGENDWMVGYGNHRDMEGCHVEIEQTEADARAKMLIYLIENKIKECEI